MSSRFPIVVALMLFPGCLELLGEDPSTFHIPPFAFGESWTYKYNQGPEFSFHVAERYLPDRYGSLFPAAGIVGSEGLVHRAFELNSGHMLWTGVHVHQRTLCGPGNEFAPVAFDYEFPVEPLRHDWETLRGRVLRVGDEVRFEAHRPGHVFDDVVEIHRRITTFTVVAETVVQVPAFGETRAAFEVRVAGQLESFDRASRTTRWNWTEYYVDGVGVPVRMTTNPFGPSYQELSAYHPGQEFIKIGSEPDDARYHRTNPDGSFKPLALLPDFSTMPLDFPPEAAFEIMGRDPRAAPAHVWLSTRPDAYARSTNLVREDAFHEWSFSFTDGREDVSVTVRREHGPAGVEESATSTVPFPAPTRNIVPAPLTPFVDAGSAWRTAKGFDPSLSDWNYMEWRLSVSDDGLRAAGFGFAGTNPESACGGSTYGPGVWVDAVTGSFTSGYVNAD